MQEFAVQPGPRGFPSVEVYRNLKLAVFDVDGVLTDGRIVYDAHGVETKFFDVRDGSGISLLVHAGLDLAVLSGRSSPVVDVRAKELRIKPERVKLGAKHKLPVFLELLREAGVEAEQVAYMGDDLVDLCVLERVGLACCPRNAHADVIKLCHAVAQNEGGRGAVRGLCEHLLKMRGDGLWEKALGRYLGR